VAPAQHELGIKFDTLVKTADHMQMYKYSLHNVAHSYGKSLTFMPKPLYGDNGSGMHTHQSIWKDGKPLFAGSGYADLSETCALLHRRHHQARQGAERLHQPSTNSYKRLVPGYEAPVLLAYSSRNRSASCRIPYVSSPKGKRVEVRFPDPGGQPVPRLRGDADGRPRRHQEQDPSGRPDGQEPVRPAAGRTLQGSDRRRLAA
jgi:glutamine synthetase